MELVLALCLAVVHSTLAAACPGNASPVNIKGFNAWKNAAGVALVDDARVDLKAPEKAGISN